MQAEPSLGKLAFLSAAFWPRWKGYFCIYRKQMCQRMSLKNGAIKKVYSVLDKT
jgi:hypothetical protein